MRLTVPAGVAIHDSFNRTLKCVAQRDGGGFASIWGGQRNRTDWMAYVITIENRQEGRLAPPERRSDG